MNLALKFPRFSYVPVYERIFLSSKKRFDAPGIQDHAGLSLAVYNKYQAGLPGYPGRPGSIITDDRHKPHRSTTHRNC